MDPVHFDAIVKRFQRSTKKTDIEKNTKKYTWLMKGENSTQF